MKRARHRKKKNAQSHLRVESKRAKFIKAESKIVVTRGGVEGWGDGQWVQSGSSVG